MNSNIRDHIERQVGRVRRRMFARELLRQAVIWSAVAIGVTTIWLLVEPLVVGQPPSWIRWAVLGSALGIAALASGIISFVRRPSATNSALWLDEAFGLRERVTTSMSLDADDAATPAGAALLADAVGRVQNLKVGERFPVRVGRAGWLVPSSAAILALVALFYEPTINPAVAETGTKPISEKDKAEIAKKLDALAKPKRDPLVNPDRAKSEELKRLEAKLEEIARQPRDNTQQLRERIKEATPLEDEIKKLERERSDKSRMMQQALQAKDAVMPNDAARDGPAKDFQKALSEGDIDKAREEMDKLAKKLANNELSEEQKQQLAKQMNELQKKLGDMAKQSQKEDMLKKLAEEGKLDAEALQRELAQLKKDNEKLKDLQKLANKMNQCQQCMKAGDQSGAQKAMSEAADQLAQMSRDKNELSDIQDQLKSLQDAKDALAKACDCDGIMNRPPRDGDGDMPGSQNPQEGPINPSDFANNGGIGQGRRPDGEQGKIRPIDSRQNAQFNQKGQKVFDGFVPGQAFKKKSSVELSGEIKQAAQEAPEAIETQRIPKAARDMAKGYFKNLGGQAEGEKKSDKPEEKKAEKPKE